MFVRKEMRNVIKHTNFTKSSKDQEIVERHEHSDTQWTRLKELEPLR